MLKTLLWLILFAIPMAQAEEVDNFTGRERALPERGEAVSELINSLVDEALQAYNRKHSKCDKDKLLRYLEPYLNTNWPEARDVILGDPKKYGLTSITELKGSVYENVSRDGLLPDSKTCCDPSIQIGGHRIGVDKIDHFLGHGLVYYKAAQTAVKSGKKKFPAHDLLDIGVEREEGGFGLVGTGVKSYADLVANMDGFLFWHVLLDYDDPIIQCRTDLEGKSQYVRSRYFDITRYVHEGWDEAINCSSFKTKIASREFDRAARSTGLRRACPVDELACEKLAVRYDPLMRKKLVHPRCLNPKKKVSAFEKSRVGVGRSLMHWMEAF